MTTVFRLSFCRFDPCQCGLSISRTSRGGFLQIWLKSSNWTGGRSDEIMTVESSLLLSTLRPVLLNDWWQFCAVMIKDGEP